MKLIEGIAPLVQYMAENRILTDRVVIELPPSEFFTLYSAVDREMRDFMKFVHDGRGVTAARQFQLMGITFREAAPLHSVTQHAIISP